MYGYEILDPRPIPAAQTANDSIFNAPVPGVLGVEVTVPALASRCTLGNIDPQHSGGNSNQAAIEAAVSIELPVDGAILATVRADLDSVGAMAVLSLRAQGVDPLTFWERINQVAEADRFARGGWPGVQPLPTRDNPRPSNMASAGDTRTLAAIAAAVSDFKLPLVDRVAMMEQWLQEGIEPTSYRDKVEKERTDMIEALEQGKIKVGTACNDQVAVVESAHRAATMVGYCLAPVVVALNPEFSFQGGPRHAKFTVCQFAGGHVDMKAALTDLQTLEPGWGGSPTIIGSPQGVASTLTTDQVAEVVGKHLL